MVLALYILGCSRVLFRISLMSALTLPIHLMFKTKGDLMESMTGSIDSSSSSSCNVDWPYCQESENVREMRRMKSSAENNPEKRNETDTSTPPVRYIT